MNQRTLIMHVGGGKAGSSALQSALSCVSDDLANIGFAYLDYYPRSSAYEITTGNGFRLFEEVARPGWETNGKETIEFFLADKPIGICSSEFLGALTRKRWERIIRTASDIDVELKIIYFVRSALGYVTSSYHQNVKRSGEARVLADAIHDYPWQHYDELQNLSAIFDDDHLQVINYDRVRTNIGEAFANAYPELAPAAELLRERGKLPVNRSLTCSELEVICRINDRFASLYSHDVSDRFLYESPHINVPTTLPGEVAEIIAGKFSEATMWINERFFPGGDGVSLELEERAQKRPIADPIERPLRIALDWALEAIENRSTEVNFIRERLLAIDWDKSEDPLIPADFDPIAYLLLNPDVLRSQLPPFYHFIQSGHCEPREYRWPLSVEALGRAASADSIKKLTLNGGDPPASVPAWQRLQHSVQVEGLLHQFAEREHEYLALISNREAQGEENEQFGQAVSQLLNPLYDLVEGLSRENNNGTADRPTEMQVLIKLAQDLTSRIGAQWMEQARLSAIIERKDKDLLEQSEGFLEMIATKDEQLAQQQAQLSAIIERKDRDLLEQSEGFLEMIAKKDEQLAQQNELLDRYREVPLSPVPEIKILAAHPARRNHA